MGGVLPRRPVYCYPQTGTLLFMSSGLCHEKQLGENSYTHTDVKFVMYKSSKSLQWEKVIVFALHTYKMNL